MDNIFGFFVILGVSASLVFGVNVPPGDDYAGKLFGSLFNNYDIQEASSPFSTPFPSVNYPGRIFGSLFDNEVRHEARNDTPSASPPPTTTTSKPTVSKPETEVVYIPVYPGPSYDPNYYPMIPPYPVLYNAPIDSRYQLDNFAPYYPVVNQFPSAYQSGVQNLPFFNQDPISSGLEKIILQPSDVDSDRMILQPIYEYSMPANLNPSSINGVFDGTIMHQPVYPDGIPSKVIYPNAIPSNVTNPNAIPSKVIKSNAIPSRVNSDTEKKIIPKPVFENETPSSLGQLTEYGRDELNQQITKLIDDYLIKTKQTAETGIEHHTEQNIDETSENSDQYKVIEPSTPSHNAYLTSPITQKQTNKGPVVITRTEVNGNYSIPDTEIVYDSDRALPALVNETFQSSIEVNQSIADIVENGIADSSKLDSNTDEEGETADTLSTISPKDLIKRLGNNQTSANDSKFNDRFTTESSTMEPTIRTFTDSKGNKCTAKTVTVNGKEYNLYTCEEKTFDGKNDEFARKTVKPDVTYFTEELPSATESAPSNARNNEASDESAKYKTESSTLNTVVYSTNFDAIE